MAYGKHYIVDVVSVVVTNHNAFFLGDKNMKPNFKHYEQIEKEIEENIISIIDIPIETYLRIGTRHTAYDCTVDSLYQKEIESIFNAHGYPTMFVTKLPNDKVKISFKL